MNAINFKTANILVHDGKTVKMSSTDFKSHLFERNKSKYGKPVRHTIQRSLGRPLVINLTWEEFEEKYSGNQFFECDTL